MLNEPCRCTAITSDQSDQLMRWKMRSRRMPALLTRMSTRPKASSAALTICVGVLRLGDRERRGDRLAARLLDLVDHLLRRAGVAARAVERRADVVDHDARALLRHQQRDGAADAAPAPVTMATLPATMPGIVSASPSSRRHAATSDPSGRLCKTWIAGSSPAMTAMRAARSALRPTPRRPPRRSCRSFAHCSSSVSVLPSSVEAKPHCGDRQSWSSATIFRRLVDAALDARPWLRACRSWW